MPPVLSAMLEAPTVVYTALLCVAALYWTIVAIGHLDLDVIEIGDAPDGGFLEFLTLDRVPVTLVATTILLCAWFLSLAAGMYLREPILAVVPEWVYATSIGLATLIAGATAAGFVLRPLKPLFRLHAARGHEHLVDLPVTITSGTADERFGTAIREISGPDILLNVVCRPGQTLRKGEQAVVVEYDAARDVYVVAPLPHLRPGFAIDDPAPPAPVVPPPTPPVKASETN